MDLMFGLWASYLLFVASWQIGARAQAVCRPGFEWIFNSQGQSPCALGGEAMFVCTGPFTALVMNALANGTYYSGMTEALANPCTCSTLNYVLNAVCALCQGYNPESSNNLIAGIVPFDVYTSKCSKTYQGFPRELPPGLAIPAYAYAPIGINDRINVAALQAARAPDSTSIPPSTPTTNSRGNAPTNSPTNTVKVPIVVTITTNGNTRMLTSTSTTASTEPGTKILPTSSADTTMSAASETNSANADNKAVVGSVKNRLNIAPIAGGIVGGLIGGMIIAFLSVCLYRRRKESRAARPRARPDMTSGTNALRYPLSYPYTPQPPSRGPKAKGGSGIQAVGMNSKAHLGSIAAGSQQMQDDASSRVDPFVHSADPSTVAGGSERTVESDSGNYTPAIEADPPAYTPSPQVL